MADILTHVVVCIVGAVLAMEEHITFEVIVSAVNLHCRRIRRIFSGSPIVVIRNGEIDQKKLRELREILARDKDVFYCRLKPQPTFLGEAIPVSGNGDATAG